MRKIKHKSGAYEKVADPNDVVEADSLKKLKDKKKESDFSQKEINELVVLLAKERGLIE